ncbi:unnamed protein product [Rhodiola kirilowii]
MDFVTSLPKIQKGNNAIWVIVDRLTKSAHFLPFKVGTALDSLVDLYVAEIVRLHGVTVFIVSDRDSSYQSSIQMAPFDALYGRKCTSPICWDDVGERQLLWQEIVRDTDTVEKIKLIRERLHVAQSKQKSYANVRRRDLEFRLETMVSYTWEAESALH